MARGTEQFHRQLDVFPIEKLQAQQFTIIGAGSLGSFTALMLAKMGAEKIKVYDDDTVEVHNLPMQFYRIHDVEKPKVEALRDLVKDFEGVEIEACNAKFTADDTLSGVVISAVDSMGARESIWKKTKFNLNVPLYIDTRAAAQVADLYFVNPSDMDHIEKYEENLFPENEAIETRCTEKMTTYIAGVVGAHVASGVSRFLKSGEVPFRRILDMYNAEIVPG